MARHTHKGTILDLGMREDMVFNLFRADLFGSSVNDVLDSTLEDGDGERLSFGHDF